MTDFHPELVPWMLVSLIVGILVTIELGYLYGLREKHIHPASVDGASGAIEASIFALLGLLLAFTFSAAQERMEFRRRLIIQEANDISTAYLRVDLLPPASQIELRQAFRDYLDSRLAVYRAVPDLKKVAAELKASKALQSKIWSMAVEGLKQGNPGFAVIVLPALNTMFDIAEARTGMAHAHTPSVIFALLFGVALLSAGVAGYGMSKSPGRNWFHRLAFVLIVSATVYVIADLEFPRRGLIRLDVTDQLLVDLRQSMD
ncbi:MAG TPA: DUF4239 domain-containing protein [bacterium]|nr:DUF4239 domain-containing protein [bacterium]